NRQRLQRMRDGARRQPEISAQFSAEFLQRRDHQRQLLKIQLLPGELSGGRKQFIEVGMGLAIEAAAEQLHVKSPQIERASRDAGIGYDIPKRATLIGRGAVEGDLIGVNAKLMLCD